MSNGCLHFDYAFDIVNGNQVNIRCTLCLAELSHEELKIASDRQALIDAKARELRTAGQHKIAALVMETKEVLRTMSRRNVLRGQVAAAQAEITEANKRLQPQLAAAGVDAETMFALEQGDTAPLLLALTSGPK